MNIEEVNQEEKHIAFMYRLIIAYAKTISTEVFITKEKLGDKPDVINLFSVLLIISELMVPYSKPEFLYDIKDKIVFCDKILKTINLIDEELVKYMDIVYSEKNQQTIFSLCETKLNVYYDCEKKMRFVDFVTHEKDRDENIIIESQEVHWSKPFRLKNYYDLVILTKDLIERDEDLPDHIDVINKTYDMLWKLSFIINCHGFKDSFEKWINQVVESKKA